MCDVRVCLNWVIQWVNVIRDMRCSAWKYENVSSWNEGTKTNWCTADMAERRVVTWVPVRGIVRNFVEKSNEKSLLHDANIHMPLRNYIQFHPPKTTPWGHTVMGENVIDRLVYIHEVCIMTIYIGTTHSVWQWARTIIPKLLHGRLVKMCSPHLSFRSTTKTAHCRRRRCLRLYSIPLGRHQENLLLLFISFSSNFHIYLNRLAVISFHFHIISDKVQRFFLSFLFFFIFCRSFVFIQDSPTTEYLIGLLMLLIIYCIL